jgi:hypothetical protein
MPPSDTISFNGRQYTLSEFTPEVVALAKEIVLKTQLLAASPLPIDGDLSAFSGAIRTGTTVKRLWMREFVWLSSAPSCRQLTTNGPQTRKKRWKLF